MIQAKTVTHAKYLPKIYGKNSVQKNTLKLQLNYIVRKPNNFHDSFCLFILAELQFNLIYIE